MLWRISVHSPAAQYLRLFLRLIPPSPYSFPVAKLHSRSYLLFLTDPCRFFCRAPHFQVQVILQASYSAQERHSRHSVSECCIIYTIFCCLCIDLLAALFASSAKPPASIVIASPLSTKKYFFPTHQDRADPSCQCIFLTSSYRLHIFPYPFLSLY